MKNIITGFGNYRLWAPLDDNKKIDPDSTLLFADLISINTFNAPKECLTIGTEVRTFRVKLAQLPGSNKLAQIELDTVLGLEGHEADSESIEHVGERLLELLSQKYESAEVTDLSSGTIYQYRIEDENRNSIHLVYDANVVLVHYNSRELNLLLEQAFIEKTNEEQDTIDKL
ncbi:MAG: hypothetical protein R3F46_04580 [bacterium]